MFTPSALDDIVAYALSGSQGMPARAEEALLEVLRVRYRRGEISCEEYARVRANLEGGAGQAEV